MKEIAPKKKKSLIKRLLKWTGITFLVLIILIILLPILFKDQIVQFIKDEANANLNTELDFGEVNLSLLSTFPKFSLEINDLTLTGLDEFKGIKLADIKQTNLKLNLWSVISGDQYEISSVGLVEPKIHVMVLPDGKANYDIVKSDSTAVEETEEKVAESKPGIVPETRTASLGGDFRFSFGFSSSSSSCGGGACCCFRCCFSGASLFSRSCFRNVSRRCLEKKRNAEAHRFGRC